MGLNAFIRRREIQAAAEGLGIDPKTAGQLANVINRDLLEGFLMKPVKPGWKTSEFWMHILSNAVSIAAVLKGILPAEAGAAVLAITQGAYTIGRSITKKGADADQQP